VGVKEIRMNCGVIPMISYEDGVAAMDWLAEAFGFTEVSRLVGPDGELSHGDMETGSGLIMLASPTPHYQSPKRHQETCEAAARWLDVPWVVDGVLVYVENVDEHYERAKSAGAHCLSEPKGGFPGRRYRVEDLEGHRWMFMERETGEEAVDE
jgi:uncharacterized glyoxalase superfamily protein PhnB